MSSSGYSVAEIPYQAPARKLGKSKFSLFRKLNLAGEGFVSTTTKPLYGALLAAALGSILLMAYSGVVLGLVALGKNVPPGWTSLVFVSGLGFVLILWFLSALGLYIADISQKVSKPAPMRIANRLAIDSSESGQGPT